MLSLSTFASGLVLVPLLSSAAPTLAPRQSIDQYSPEAANGTPFLLGGKVNIRSHSNQSLFWNASFPDPSFSEAFTSVNLTEKINDSDISVSTWFVNALGEGRYSIE